MTTADASSPLPQPSSHHMHQFATANIYRCLAPCKDCTGNYISEILQKQFVCCCRCHHHNNTIKQNDFGSISTPHFSETST